MEAPVHRLKKDELVWLASHRCRKHRHSYLTHYQCYLAEHPDHRRIAFFDVESTHLKGNFGLLLSYCLLDDATEQVHSGLITRTDLLNPKMRDRRIMARLIDDLSRYDMIVTYYGTRFDIPFVRTRAMVHGLTFPHYGMLKHKDLYYTVRYRFSLHSNRLDVACRTLVGESSKTTLLPDIWQAAAYGDRKALQYILEHNIEDVKDTRRLYYRVLEYAYPGLRTV